MTYSYDVHKNQTYVGGKRSVLGEDSMSRAARSCNSNSGCNVPVDVVEGEVGAYAITDVPCSDSVSDGEYLPRHVRARDKVIWGAVLS